MAHIGAGKHRCKFTSGFQTFPDGSVTILVGITDTLVIPLLVEGNAMGTESPHTALKPQTAGIRIVPVTADNGDFPVSQINQHLHSALGRCRIVGADTG